MLHFMEQTPHILVIDDDREIRELLARFLEKQRIRVTAVRDAKEAPHDILDLPIFRYSPMKDPNKSVFQSAVTRPEDQFSVPSYMKPSNYIDDPYAEKK